MAIIANTFQSPSAKVNREVLSDVVSRITPEDTPIYSGADKMSWEGIHPEWATDDLAAPADNFQLEGDEYAFGATVAAVRAGNYTQILRKEGIISGTQDNTANAGSVEQVKYQKLKKGVELRKDVEFSIVTANASISGATRKSGSLSTWLATNVSRGATGANGGFSQGTGFTVAPTNGTQRAFTKVLLDTVMQLGYNSGANFKQVYCSPYVKSVFVTFMSDTNVAVFRNSVNEKMGNTIVATADMYKGPFGEVFVQPNRVMATSPAVGRNVFFVDPEYLSWGWFRKIAEDKLVAKTGDAQKFVLIGEGALKVANEKGLGVVADVFGITAAS